MTHLRPECHCYARPSRRALSFAEYSVVLNEPDTRRLGGAGGAISSRMASSMPAMAWWWVASFLVRRDSSSSMGIISGGIISDHGIARTHANGQRTVSVNQQANGGSWNMLGTYSFNAGAATVSLSD